MPTPTLFPTPLPLDVSQALPAVQQLSNAAGSFSLTQIGMSILALILIWSMFELLWHVLDQRVS